MVERFDWSYFPSEEPDGGMRRNSVGDWVRYSDYAALEKRFFASNRAAEAAEAALAEARKALAELIENNRKGAAGEKARKAWMAARRTLTGGQGE